MSPGSVSAEPLLPLSEESADRLGRESYERLLELRVVDEDGVPVPHLSLEVAQLPGKWVPGESPASTTPLQTNADGVVMVEVGRVTMAHIRLVSDAWACVWDSESPHARAVHAGNELDRRTVVIQFGYESAPSRTLVLRPVRSFQVYVEFSDGLPFEGELTATFFSDATRQVLERRVRYTTTVPATSIELYGRAAVSIGGKAIRAGYARSFSLQPTEDDLKLGTARIVIPADERRAAPCGIILDHTHFSDDQTMTAALLSNGSSLGKPLVLSGPGETRTPTAPPARAVSVLAYGHGTVWSSGAVVLAPGEWLRIVVRPEIPACLTLRVQRSDGTPIAGAILSAVEAGRANWISPVLRQLEPGGRPMDGENDTQDPVTRRANIQRAKSDASGLIRLSGTWPGTRQFQVEAQGFEPERLEAHLLSGQQTELPVVVLREATASVEVRLAGEGIDPAGYETLLFLREGGASHNRKFHFSAAGFVKITGVPSGSYQVWVSRSPKGGFGWSRMLTLKQGEDAIVTIDVTRPTGVQSD